MWPLKGKLLMAYCRRRRRRRRKGLEEKTGERIDGEGGRGLKENCWKRVVERYLTEEGE